MTNGEKHKFDDESNFLDNIDWDTVWIAFKIISMDFSVKKGDGELADKIGQLVEARYNKWLKKNLDTTEMDIAMRLLFAKQTTMDALYSELLANKNLSFLANMIDPLNIKDN